MLGHHGSLGSTTARCLGERRWFAQSLAGFNDLRSGSRQCGREPNSLIRDRPKGRLDFGLNAKLRIGKIGGLAKTPWFLKETSMPEPDYNPGEPAGFWPWFVTFSIVIALFLWYAACS